MSAASVLISTLIKRNNIFAQGQFILEIPLCLNKSYIFKSENSISAMAYKYSFTISWPLSDYIYLVKKTKTSKSTFCSS